MNHTLRKPNFNGGKAYDDSDGVTRKRRLNAIRGWNPRRTMRNAVYAIIVLILSFSLSATPIQAALCPVMNMAVNYPKIVSPGQWVQIDVTVIVACSLSAIGGIYQGTIKLMPTGITRVITTQAILGPTTSVIVAAPVVTGWWNLTVVVTITDQTYGLGGVDSITNQMISIQVQNPIAYTTATVTAYQALTVTAPTPMSTLTSTTVQSISLTPPAQPYLQFSTILFAVAFAITLFTLRRTRQKTSNAENEKAQEPEK